LGFVLSPLSRTARHARNINRLAHATSLDDNHESVPGTVMSRFFLPLAGCLLVNAKTAEKASKKAD